jgi:hypothetical protein
MKTFLLIPSNQFPFVPKDEKRKAVEPFKGSDHVVVDGCCPVCKVEPFKVSGNGMRASDDDRAWEANGFCRSCTKAVGKLRVETDTLFGVTEDRAVLNGPYLVL